MTGLRYKSVCGKYKKGGGVNPIFFWYNISVCRNRCLPTASWSLCSHKPRGLALLSTVAFFGIIYIQQQNKTNMKKSTIICFKFFGVLLGAVGMASLNQPVASAALFVAAGLLGLRWVITTD